MATVIPKIVDGIQCPQCNGESAVIDSRDGHDARRRRRKCSSCSFRYTTYEIHAKDYERMQALPVDMRQIDSIITALNDIKARFTDSNGHQS